MQEGHADRETDRQRGKLAGKINEVEPVGFPQDLAGPRDRLNLASQPAFIWTLASRGDTDL